MMVNAAEVVVAFWLAAEVVIGSWLAAEVVVGSWLAAEVVVGSWLAAEVVVGSWLAAEVVVGSWLPAEVVVGSWLPVVPQMLEVEAPLAAAGADLLDLPLRAPRRPRPDDVILGPGSSGAVPPPRLCRRWLRRQPEDSSTYDMI